MGWSDELYDNEPGLAPVKQEGGHVIGLLADSLGVGPWLRGEWEGAPQGTHSPLWGRGSGSKTGWIRDTIPVPIAKNEAPMANIIGAVPWPVKGAMVATGIIPTALKAAESRAALAKSNVPRDAAIGKLLDDAPGIAENAWNVGKEGLEWLGQKLGGIVPEGIGIQPAMEGAMARPPMPEAAYRPILHRVLGKHTIIVPHIPNSTAEPLLLKTTGPDIANLAEAIPGWERNARNLGIYSPRWSKEGGTVIGTTIEKQGTTIPHEYGHDLEDLLTSIFSVGKRPREQEINATAKYAYPAKELFPGWKPLQEGGMDDMMMAYRPGMRYQSEADEYLAQLR